MKKISVKFAFLFLTVVVFMQNVHARQSDVSLQSEAYLQRVDSADIYIKQCRWIDAERMLKEAMRIEPGNINNSLLLSNLGIVQHNQNKLDEAIESFSIGLAMTPNSFILLKNRASAYIDAGMIDEAYGDLTAAYRIDPDDLWVRNYHGLLALQKNELQTAYNDFSFMLEKDSKSVEALTGMAIWAELSGELTLAIDKYTQILEIRRTADDYFARAFLYIRTDNLTAADDDVREGLKIDRYCGDLYLLRAYLNKLRYRNEDAELDKNIAIEYGADVQLVQMLFPQ